MKGYTKTGLVLLMIGVVLMVCTSLASFSFYASFQPSSIQGSNYSYLFSLIPLAVLGGIASLLSILGGLFILLGRKEFGDRHRKFVTYALIVFLVVIVLTIVFSVWIALTISTFVFQGLTSGSGPQNVNVFHSFISLSLVNALIISIVSGLMWVFGLYQLESKKGRTILFAAYAAMIVTAGITIINSTRIIDAWINQGTLNNVFNQSGSTPSQLYPQLLSSSYWNGPTGLVLLTFQIIQAVLLFAALYIPFQRINKGELQMAPPVGKTEMICPTCGRTIPADAVNCPYCGTQL